MCNKKDYLGDRIKTYENSYRIKLPIRLPVIIRIDGKSFHQYTKNFKRPIDERFIHIMDETAKYCCSNIQGCQIAYVQSDEISFLLTNYKNLNTQSWFDNNLQKIVSISAGLASAFFTNFSYCVLNEKSDLFNKIAIFDSRAFVIPKEEVNNYFLWRQQDATRNS